MTADEIRELEVGSILYEYGLGCCFKSEVTKKPVEPEPGVFEWVSFGCNSGSEVFYKTNTNYTQMNLKLYTYEAYRGMKEI